MTQHLLTDIRIYPDPNKALAAALMDPRLARYMIKVASQIKELYQARVAVRSGRLKASAHVKLEKGGKRNDRWVSSVVIGGQAVRNPGDGFRYTLVHEFGSPAKRTQFPPAHDLKSVTRQAAT